MLIEITTGKFAKDIVDPSVRYKLPTPSGVSPTVETVIRELNRSEKSPEVVDLRGEFTQEETLQRNVFNRDKNGESWAYIARMLLLTDSANIYASLLCGKGSSMGKSVRIQVSYLRDISDVMAITFLGQIYNLADSGSKDRGGHHALLVEFLTTGMFKIGFLGRKKTKELTGKEGKDKVSVWEFSIFNVSPRKCGKLCKCESDHKCWIAAIIIIYLYVLDRA